MMMCRQQIYGIMALSHLRRYQRKRLCLLFVLILLPILLLAGEKSTKQPPGSSGSDDFFPIQPSQKSRPYHEKECSCSSNGTQRLVPHRTKCHSSNDSITDDSFLSNRIVVSSTCRKKNICFSVCQRYQQLYIYMLL
jgi:hypothetical protein